MIPLSRKTMKLGSFLKVKVHLTATGSIQDVCLAQCYRTTNVPQSGPILPIPVQTQALPEKPSHGVQAVLEKRLQLQFLIYLLCSM